MTTPHHPAGPARQRVPGVGRPTEAQRARIVARLRVATRRVTDVAHPRALRDWGAADEGPFPTREVVEARIRRELDLLAEGLGPFAALEPEAVFPDLRRTAALRRRPPAPWPGWGVDRDDDRDVD